MTRFAAFVAFVTSAAVASADPTTVLDTAANGRLFDTHFGRYGPRPTRVVTREAKGVRLKLPAEAKGAKPTGLYSYFALAGDFEVAAAYEVIDVPEPTAGYGAGFGLAVETKGPDGDVTVRRGQWKGEGSGVQVVRGRPDAAGVMGYEATFFPTKAKKGRVVLRREKAELVVRTSDSPTGEPTELTRVPFTDKTIRTLLVFADSGGSPTVVDGRLTGLTVTAGEITGGIPERDRDHTPWWVIAVAVALAVVIGVVIWRRVVRRRKAE